MEEYLPVGKQFEEYNDLIEFEFPCWLTSAILTM